MPPKKKKKSKVGRKLTKAQKAKQQQEEEERRLREEEEALLQAEREEKERLERELKEKEIERLELKDRERRDDELNELRLLLEENHTAVTKWKTDAVEATKWERYMRCDGAPDPEVQNDVNTYISLWREDPDVNITSVLKQCDLALQLVEELEDLFNGTSDPKKSQQHQEAFMNLQELIHFKHLLTSEEILKNASANIDTETGNMQTVIRDDKLTLCLWANLKKNPRFKGLTFEEAGLGFELPKQLAVSDVAVRILHTRYDHLSALARMTHLPPAPSRRSLAGDEDLPDDPSEQGEPDVIVEAGEDADALLQKREEEEEEEEVQSVRGSEGRKSAASVKSTKSSLQPTEGHESQIETQMEALSVAGDLSSSSEQLRTGGGGVPAVDLKQFSPLGGVFYYDVFHLPPQAHQARGWEIRQLSENGLQVFPYPTEKSGSDDDEARPSVGVSVKLPDSVVFLGAPQVARWDPAGRQWRTDGITDVSYEESEDRMSFRMDSFQAFVLMQGTYANLPFRSWELRPLGQDSALLTVKGPLLGLSITIKDNQCMLQLDRERGLPLLEGKWMSGPALQRAMVEAGVNIFVNEFTDKYINTCGKDPLTEHAAYEQMALLASACAFSWSKWNSKCGGEHLVVQVCEHLSPEPVPEDSWGLYLLGAQRSQKLEITERSATFSPDHCPGSEFHSTFMHTLQDAMSPEGVARSRSSHFLFVDTVQSLLCATRPLMYA